MRGDHAPSVTSRHSEPHRQRFKEGLVTIIDASHGIGTHGRTGRGGDSLQYRWTSLLGPLAGLRRQRRVRSSPEAVIEVSTPKADVYLHQSAECGGSRALRLRWKSWICGGARRLVARSGTNSPSARIGRSWTGEHPGKHPVVPMMVRDENDLFGQWVCRKWCTGWVELSRCTCYAIRPFVFNAATSMDINQVLAVLATLL